MRIVFVGLDDMVCEWMVNSLRELEGHEIDVVFLNRLPDVGDSLIEAIAGAELIVYAGPAGGPYAPATETLRHVRKWAPTVLLCFDGSDVGWHALLAEYRRHECFDLIVNCDGAAWPKTEKDLTLWCPVGRSGFPTTPAPLKDRSIPFGFCGGHRSDPRRALVDHLVAHAGLTVKPRDDRYGTYRAYTDFLGDCRIVLNVAYSAGGPHGRDPMTKQFKARIVECGFAGACVLETRGSAASDWLTPGEDFLTYETAEEAAWIVKTASAEYLQRVASSLHRRVNSELSPQRFWTRVFERLE